MAVVAKLWCLYSYVKSGLFEFNIIWNTVMRTPPGFKSEKKSRKSFGLLEFAPKDYFQCQTLLKALSPCPKRFLVLAGSGWRRTQKQIHQVWISCEGTLVLFYILMFSWNLEGLNFRNQFIFKCCVISCFYVSPVLSVGGFGGNPVGCLKGC